MLWGQFEELLALGANDTEVLDKGFDSRNFSLPLVLQAPALNSRLFTAMPDYIRDIVTKQNVTYNNHAAGITPEHMASLHTHMLTDEETDFGDWIGVKRMR